MDNIIKQLNLNKYDFMRENSYLGNNIILLTVGGSYAYGTNIENISDIDIRGITLNTPKEILTMKCYDKPYEDIEIDTVIYPFSHVIPLLLNNNPNTIEMLGCKQYIKLSEEGKMLKDNANLFLSKRVINSFSGYATSQLRRLENALARNNHCKTEEHILNTIENQMYYFQKCYAEITNQNIKLYLDNSVKEKYEKEIFIDVDLKHYPLRDFKNIISEMTNIIRSYTKLTNRNKKKDELHLNKHAMHLLRLLIMGTEILQSKCINTYRENEKEFLLKVRNGEYTYNEIFEMADEYENKFKYASENTDLPDEPNYSKINEIVMEINKKVIYNAYSRSY
jgi:predicted nucleotidyltransferase